MCGKGECSEHDKANFDYSNIFKTVTQGNERDGRSAERAFLSGAMEDAPFAMPPAIMREA